MSQQSTNIEGVTHDSLIAELVSRGFVRPRRDENAWLPAPTNADWDSFAETWDRLGLDRYMADGGRYRRRRHAALAVGPERITRKPHQPHFQSRDYNQLNGDVQRWFEAMEDGVVDSPMMQRLLRGATTCFEGAEGRAATRWHVELHQFRIEATAGRLGRPTPEGMHRDGVDWVLVLLVDRQNADEGVTEVQVVGQPGLDRFILAQPGDVVLLNDHRVMHGVTPIRPIDPTMPAYRDVFVATWKAEGLG